VDSRFIVSCQCFTLTGTYIMPPLMGHDKPGYMINLWPYF